MAKMLSPVSQTRARRKPSHWSHLFKNQSLGKWQDPDHHGPQQLHDLNAFGSMAKFWLFWPQRRWSKPIHVAQL